MNIADQYAETLIAAADKKNETEFNVFFDNFVGLLKEKKHYSLLPTIMRSVERLSREEGETGKTMMVVREAALAGEYQDIIEQNKDVFGTDYDVVEDKNIVGGYMIKNRTNIIDGSYRTGLMKLYKKLVG